MKKRCLLGLICAGVLFFSACGQTPAVLSETAPAVTTADGAPTAKTVSAKKAEKTTKTKTEKTKKTTAQTATEREAEQKTTKRRQTRATTKRRAATTAQATTVTYSYLTSARASKATQKRSFGKTVKVACVGDSITKNGYWENNLQGALSSAYTVEGFGVNGSTALYFGTDNDSSFKAYVDSEEYKRSLRADADIVVVMLGTNDSKPFNWSGDMDNPRQFIIDTTDLVRSYQQATGSPTVFLALPPTVYKPFAGITNETIEASIIPALRQVVRDTGAILIDTHAATANAEKHFADGVHPSDNAGRKLIADAVAAAITEYVGVK